MKNKTILFITGCITLLLFSCLGSDDETESTVISNAQIKTIALSHDSISGISDLKFTIDQLNELIYNKDSMPYGTVVGLVKCDVTYDAGAVSTVEVEAGDSTYTWNGSDSIDFSKPVKMEVTALDGLTVKSYTVQVNIHTVVPDSMIWTHYTSRMTGQTADEQKLVVFPLQDKDTYLMYVRTSDDYALYASSVTDAKEWTQLPLSGLSGNQVVASQITVYNGKIYAPSDNGVLYASADGQNWSADSTGAPVKSLLGVLEEGDRQEALLSAIIEKDGSYSFARMNPGGEWTEGNPVPDNFPLKGFGKTSYVNMYHPYLMVLGGRDTNNKVLSAAWATADAVRWVVMTDEETDFFTPREGTILTGYDGKLFMAGGLDAAGRALKDIYLSSDFGVTWAKEDSMLVFPTSYVARGYASVYVDEDNYMLIFGGKISSNAKTLDDIWRGRINRLGFKD